VTSDLLIGGRTINTPTYFPSISSVKTSLPMISYIRALKALPDLTDCFLLSAYDVADEISQNGYAVYSELQSLLDSGVVILLDSGNYESYWKERQDTWTQDRFHAVLEECPKSIAFGFDFQAPPQNIDEHVSILLKQFEQDAAHTSSNTIVPIIHGTPDSLPDLCLRVAAEAGVGCLAIAERDLGASIFERYTSMVNIREALDSSGKMIGLHVLGTGNPYSIALYTHAGANTFDGLEWCQIVIDHETGTLFHQSQADFFRDQSGYLSSDLSFQPKLLAHNLEFYQKWIRNLRYAASHDDIPLFCLNNFPSSIFNVCSKELGWT